MAHHKSKPLSLDREFAAAVAAAGEAAASRNGCAAGDVDGRRKYFDQLFAGMAHMFPAVPDITTTEHEVQSHDGKTITVTQLRPGKAATKGDYSPSPAIYHMHGGGMILGNVKQFTPFIAKWAESSGLPVFTVDYRLAPEFPHPTPVEDCYAGLTWLSSHAEELGVDASKILILGESAGGGLAAGLGLLARDRALEPPISYQMLIYPMIDDRNVKPIEGIEEFASWKAADNETGWGALLGKSAGTDEEVEGIEYAAPARAKSLAGLPPTYIDVGQLDIFAPEDLKYAARLIEAGVQTEFHLYPGLPHAFEGLGAATAVVKSAVANRERVIEAFKKGSVEVEAKL